MDGRRRLVDNQRSDTSQPMQTVTTNSVNTNDATVFAPSTLTVTCNRRRLARTETNGNRSRSFDAGGWRLTGTDSAGGEDGPIRGGSVSAVRSHRLRRIGHFIVPAGRGNREVVVFGGTSPIPHDSPSGRDHAVEFAVGRRGPVTFTGLYGTDSTDELAKCSIGRLARGPATAIAAPTRTVTTGGTIGGDGLLFSANDVAGNSKRAAKRTCVLLVVVVVIISADVRGQDETNACRRARRVSKRSCPGGEQNINNETAVDMRTVL